MTQLNAVVNSLADIAMRLLQVVPLTGQFAKFGQRITRVGEIFPLLVSFRTETIIGLVPGIVVLDGDPTARTQDIGLDHGPGSGLQV